MYRGRYARLVLLLFSLPVFYYVVQIFRPFLLPVALAAVLVSLCYPAFDWIRGRLKGRSGLAALVTCLGMTALILLPFALILTQVTTQAKEIYDKFQAALDQGEWQGPFWQLREGMIPDRLQQFVERYVDLDRVGLGQLDLGEGLATLLEKLSLFLLEHSSELVTGLLSFVTSFLIMLITMFFLFRDSARLTRDFRHLSPLSDEYQRQIMSTFRQVASATVVGSLVTAVVQGIAGGLVFWIVGIDQAIFWGTLTAFFSLVPVVGTAIVWVPWAIYLLSTVSGASGFVFIGLFLLVGLLDNVVRPFFIEGRVKMHSLLVFFSLMGGVSYLGLPGLIFGPILVALGLSFLELFQLEFGQRATDRPSE